MNKIVIALCAYFAAAEPIELTASSFVETVIDVDGNYMSDRGTFVKFYAPWCAHCETLVPIWEELDEFSGEELAVAKMNCITEENKHFCKFLGVTSFPTVLYYPPNGEFKG